MAHTYGGRSRARLALGLAVALSVALTSGCGLPFVSPAASRGPNHTIIHLQLIWGATGTLAPPVTTTCSRGGHHVKIQGEVGPEEVTLRLSGLGRGQHYQFVAFQPAVSATVTLNERGPLPLAKDFGLPNGDSVAPIAGLEPENASGTLTVARTGLGGSLNVALPHQELVSGTWRCGSRRRVGTPNRPVLRPAIGPPAEAECWSGTLTSAGWPSPTCANGDVNVAAWIPAPLAVESAGKDAPLATVEAALCEDQRSFAGFPKGFLQDEYGVASAYYGWDFRLTASQAIAAANCPAA